MENKIKVELSLSEVEDITHHYLMSWCEWSTLSSEEFEKGNEDKGEIMKKISQDKKVLFEKFEALRNKMEEVK